MKYSSIELWEATKILDNAETYLANYAGEQDVFWDDNLQESTLLLRALANQSRRKAIKSEGK
jgi:hypothetical protein